MSVKKKTRRIPIKAAKHIAHEYEYDQVVILARKVTTDDHEGGEWVVTYGVNAVHCDVAKKMGEYLGEEILTRGKSGEER